MFHLKRGGQFVRRVDRSRKRELLGCELPIIRIRFFDAGGVQVLSPRLRIHGVAQNHFLVPRVTWKTVWPEQGMAIATKGLDPCHDFGSERNDVGGHLVIPDLLRIGIRTAAARCQATDQADWQSEKQTNEHQKRVVQFPSAHAHALSLANGFCYG